VGAQAGERVLLTPDLPEVLPVAVQVEHVSELARLDQLLQLAHARVIEQQVPWHQHELALPGDRHELLRLGRVHRHRLLDEDVLAGEQRPPREVEVRHDGRGDDDRLELGIGEQLVEVGRHARAGIARGEARAVLVGEIAEPRQVGNLVEVPREVRTPVAEAGQADPHLAHRERLARRSAILAEARPSP
jgi:hypothetical protein